MFRKFFTARRSAVLTVAVLLIMMASAIYIVVSATPGAEDDPLITKSYLDKVITEQVNSIVDAKINSALSSGGTVDKAVEKKVDSMLGDVSSFGYKTVTLSENQKLYGEEGTEFIVRSGIALCISQTASTGIYDMTDGTLVTNGVRFTVNHYFIMNRNDRGVKADTKCEILVRGKYTIS